MGRGDGVSIGLGAGEGVCDGFGVSLGDSVVGVTTGFEVVTGNRAAGVPQYSEFEMDDDRNGSTIPRGIHGGAYAFPSA